MSSLDARCILVRSWDAVSPGIVSVEDMDDLFKLFAENLEELKSCGTVEENFDMNEYDDVDFDVSVVESSFLTDLEILVTVCNVEEQDDTEDEELIEQDSVEPPKKLPLPDGL